MKFLQKPGIQVVVILLVCGFVWMGVYATKDRTRATRVDPSKASSEALSATTPEREYTERGEEVIGVVQNIVDTFELPPPKEVPPAQAPPQEKEVVPQPERVVIRESEEAERTAFPSLFHVYNSSIEELEEPQLEQPKIYGPRGLLVKAVLVLTVDSSDFDTPVLALVTEDVYWNGNLLVPAGTQVFAKASQGKFRDRIEVNGEFTFVWADGREYKIKGLALDHQLEDDGTYSLTDGSAGIRGEVIESDDKALFKLLAAELISGFAEGSQSSFDTPFGAVPEQSLGNSSREGVSSAGSRYAELILGKIEQDLSFVRVAAGTEFYIFTEDVFEPDLASVAGVVQGNQARSSFDIQRGVQELKEAREALRRGEESAAQARRGQAELDAYSERVRELIRQNSNSR